jgi:hypothetical protein
VRNRRRRGLNRGRNLPPIPKHPYRDTAVLHAALALLICGLALLTGGDLGTAAVVAAAYFLVASAWSWSRFAHRIRSGADADGQPEPEPEGEQ